jgi:hypothetical protein
MKTWGTALALAVLAAVAVANAGSQPDGAMIRNTGSTNFSGYTIKVWSDGRTSTVHTNRSGQAIDHPAAAIVPKTLVAQFFNDLRSAQHARPVGETCMKSASFGTTTVVVYHGWTSPDLECGGDGHVIALGSDAKKIAAQLRVQSFKAHRIPMLPNEPRRTETNTAQPSATPEPAPSAS